MDIFHVSLSRKAERDLKKIPKHIVMKLIAWIELVGKDGLSEARKISGYHDEPLLGKRKQQRSIRLSLAYRAIYKVNEKNEIHFVEILEVNKHEY